MGFEFIHDSRYSEEFDKETADLSESDKNDLQLVVEWALTRNPTVLETNIIYGGGQRIPGPEEEAAKWLKMYLQARDRLTATKDALAQCAGVLREVEWEGVYEDTPACPECGEYSFTQKHSTRCALASALKAADEAGTSKPTSETARE